jgi:hypothetical protein
MLLTKRPFCQVFLAAAVACANRAGSLFGLGEIVAGRERFRLFACERADKIDNALADFWVVNSGECHVEMQALRGRQEIRDKIGLGIFRNAHEAGFLSCRWLERRSAFKKIGGRNFQDPRNLLEPAGADPVNALFIFLDLLKCQAQGISQFFLTHAKRHTPHADAAADVPIDGVGGFFHESGSNRHASGAPLGSGTPEQFGSVGTIYSANAAKRIMACMIFQRHYCYAAGRRWHAAGDSRL